MRNESPVLAYRSEAADAIPPDARNVLAGTLCILLIAPCALAAFLMAVIAADEHRELWKRLCTGALALAAAGTVPCCVIAARHHFKRRPPMMFDAGKSPPDRPSGGDPGALGP